MNTEEMIDGLLRDRADAARGALTAHEEVVRIEAQLQEARRSYSVAYRSAADAGWTDKELAKMGLSRPVNRGGGRPKGSPRKTSTPEAHGDPVSA